MNITIKIDWIYVANDLARQLSAITERTTIERTLKQAQEDARGLKVPAGFWTLVAVAYCQRERRAGRTPKQEILEGLRGSVTS